MSNNSNDSLINKAVLAGSSAAFKTFFKRHYKQLLGFVLTLTKDRDQAEDITQLAFITIWKKRAQIQEVSGLKQYLFQTGKNLYIDQYRQSRSRTELYAKLTSEAFENQWNEEEDQIEEQIKKLRKIIAKLPERCQHILRMTKLEGLSQQEVADHLNISKRTVESQIRLAYKKIREHFDQDDPLILLLLNQAIQPSILQKV